MTEPDDDRPTEEELQRALDEINSRLETKVTFLTQMGIEIPALVITKLRMEYWISVIANTMDEGDRWLLENEIAWGQSMLTFMDEGIRQRDADEVASALHLP